MPTAKPRPFRELGDALRRLRTLADLKQEELSQRTGISQSYITKLENGYSRATPEVLRPLVKALGGIYSDFAPLAGFTDKEADDDIDIADPELMLLFRQLQTTDVPESDLKYVKEVIRLALRARRGEADEHGP